MQNNFCFYFLKKQITLLVDTANRYFKSMFYLFTVLQKLHCNTAKFIVRVRADIINKVPFRRTFPCEKAGHAAPLFSIFSIGSAGQLAFPGIIAHAKSILAADGAKNWMNENVQRWRPLGRSRQEKSESCDSAGPGAGREMQPLALIIIKSLLYIQGKGERQLFNSQTIKN